MSIISRADWWHIFCLINFTLQGHLHQRKVANKRGTYMNTMKGAAKEDASPIWAASNLLTKAKIAIPMVMARVQDSNIVGIDGLKNIFLVI